MGRNRWNTPLLRRLGVFLLIAFLGFLTGCGVGENPAESSKEVASDPVVLVESGKLIVGTSADYPPYEFRLPNDDEGRIVGLDMDIAQDIADALNVRLEVRDILFSQLFTHLESGDVDMIIAGLTPTEARRKVADFSEIYYQAFQAVLIRRADGEKIKSIGDLRGKKVGVQQNSIQQDMARTLIVGAEFVPGETIHGMVETLEKGEVDALVLEKPVAEAFQARSDKFMSIEEGVDANMIGSAIAVHKGNGPLLEEINRIIRRLKQQNRIIGYVEDAKVLSNK